MESVEMKQEPSSEDVPDVAAPGEARPEVRLLAIDLDGTLLTDAKEIAPKTADALRSLRDRGVRVMIASARPPRSTRRFHELLKLDTLQINYNGALIWDEGKRRPFFHQPMTAALVRRIVGRARALFEQVLVTCEILDRWYTDRFDQTYTTETGRLFRPDVVAPLDEFINQPITKLMLLGHPRIVRSLHQTLVCDFGSKAAIIRADPELLQIAHHSASKAAALHMVAKHYRIPMSKVMAIGDAPNDVEMLQAAGLAVAMDNAHPSVKAAAHWVAPSNNDHGVYAALRRFGLAV